MKILNVAHVVPIFIEYEENEIEHTIFGYLDYGTQNLLIPNEEQRNKVDIDKLTAMIFQFNVEEQERIVAESELEEQVPQEVIDKIAEVKGMNIRQEVEEFRKEM